MTHDHTRRETIEYDCPYIKKCDAGHCRLADGHGPDHRCAALASAEPLAREAGEAGKPDPDFLLADARARVAGVNLDGSQRREGVSARPAPAPAAETDGLVERLTRELAEARNRLSFATQEIDRLRAHPWPAQLDAISSLQAARGSLASTKNVLTNWDNELSTCEAAIAHIDRTIARVESAQLAARTQAPAEIAEAMEELKRENERLKTVAEFNRQWVVRLRAQTPADTRTSNLAEAFRCVDDMDWDYLVGLIGDGGRDRFWKAIFKDLRVRLLTASTGSRQEGADERLPCDVMLPPATRIAKGCTFETLRLALSIREGRPEADLRFSMPALRAQPSSQDTVEAMRLAAEIDEFIAVYSDVESPTHQRAAVWFLKQARAALPAAREGAGP